MERVAGKERAPLPRRAPWHKLLRECDKQMSHYMRVANARSHTTVMNLGFTGHVQRPVPLGDNTDVDTVSRSAQKHTAGPAQKSCACRVRGLFEKFSQLP